MQANSTVKNPPPIVTSGSLNMPAVMEGLAQIQDGLRKMALNGARIPLPRSLSNGSCVILLTVPEHLVSVMEGEKGGSGVFCIDGHSVMEGWQE